MRRWSGLTLVVVVAILVSAAWAAAAGTATATYVYVVAGLEACRASAPVSSSTRRRAPSVTATGAICPYGGSFCPGPNGDVGWNTTGILYGGFPLPGAPAWGLLARVGSGPWVQVGSGPTTVAGTGVLEFAVNDDFLADNTGSVHRHGHGDVVDGLRAVASPVGVTVTRTMSTVARLVKRTSRVVASPAGVTATRITSTVARLESREQAGEPGSGCWGARRTLAAATARGSHRAGKRPRLKWSAAVRAAASRAS